MSDLYTPHSWYWQHDDGKVFSSAVPGIIDAADPAFAAWRALGRAPTRWPEDEQGAQSDAALNAVLAPYGLSVQA